MSVYTGHPSSLWSGQSRSMLYVLQLGHHHYPGSASLLASRLQGTCLHLFENVYYKSILILHSWFVSFQDYILFPNTHGLDVHDTYEHSLLSPTTRERNFLPPTAPHKGWIRSGESVCFSSAHWPVLKRPFHMNLCSLCDCWKCGTRGRKYESSTHIPRNQ